MLFLTWGEQVGRLTLQDRIDIIQLRNLARLEAEQRDSFSVTLAGKVRKRRELCESLIPSFLLGLSVVYTRNRVSANVIYFWRYFQALNFRQPCFVEERRRRRSLLLISQSQLHDLPSSLPVVLIVKPRMVRTELGAALQSLLSKLVEICEGASEPDVSVLVALTWH